MTLHSPKSHNLSRLRAMTDGFDERLITVWPTETKFQKRAFELLKQGYVNARYSEHYTVTSAELAVRRERIEVLGSLVVEICQQRLSCARLGVGLAPTPDIVLERKLDVRASGSPPRCERGALPSAWCQERSLQLG